MPKKNSGNLLLGKKLYIPRMSIEGGAVFAAAFRCFGVEAYISPESDTRTLDLANQYVSGDECYPEIVTLGNFLKVVESEDFNPDRTAFCLPTAGGPCRFGQYRNFLIRVLKNKGLNDVTIISPSSKNSYEELGEYSSALTRLAWRALISADILRKLLLKTRPYEINRGETDAVHAECLKLLCQVIENPEIDLKRKFHEIINTLIFIRDKFRMIPANYTKKKPLIGVVGEIFCRLNEFSNSWLIKIIEDHGGEAWLSNIAEWVWYTNFERERRLRLDGKKYSLEMLSARIKNFIQKRDEHKLFEPFIEDFYGYEEPSSVKEVLEYSKPYLPYWGALGEMVLSVGTSVYLYNKGVDGVVDISPFTCMNGIVCEAVFPNVSRDHDNIPIRNFYFDGTQSDLDRDIGIFMELALTYKNRKSVKRRYPFYFN